MARLVRRYWTAAVVVVLLTAAVVVATSQDGFTAKAVDLGMGSVWVTSQGPGQLALLDGASAAVTVRLKVADGGHDITAVQGHRAGYAVDRTTGTVIRADAATWHATATVPIDGATTGLHATAAGPALYLTDVQRGLVLKTDPDTLQPSGQPQSLSATRGSGTPVADTTGALWLLDSTNGDLIRMTDTPQRTEPGFAAGTSSRLLLVQGDPVVVDLTDREATPIDPQTGHRNGSPVCVDIDPADPTVTVAGSATEPVVYLVSGRDGLLRITDLTAGTCNQAIPIATPGNDLGEPVDMAGKVFIPNRTTGQVIIVDPRTRQQDVTNPLVPPNTAFELLGQDGFVYYNDPISNIAGVVRNDGSVRPIAKYDQTDPDRGVHQDPQPQTQSTSESPGEATNNPAVPSAEASSGAAQNEAPPGTTTSAATARSTAATAGSPSPTSDPGSLSSAPPTISSLGRPPPASVSTVPTVPTSPTSPTGPTGPSPEVLTATATGPSAAHVGDHVDLTVTASSGTITHAAWDFGDGGTAEATTGSTSHAWSATSNQPYQVQVVVTVQDGRTANAKLQIQITEQPPVILTIQQPTGGGITDGLLLTCPSTCNNAYPRGSSVHLAANPNTGKLFTGWTGDCAAETTSTCILTMSDNRTAGAMFADDPDRPRVLTVTAPANGGSIVSEDGSIDCPGQCTKQVTSDTQITLYAHSTARFSGWTGTCATASGYVCAFILNGDMTVGATITPCPLANCVSFERTPGGPAFTTSQQLNGPEFAGAGLSTIRAAPPSTYCADAVGAVKLKYQFSPTAVLTTMRPGVFQECDGSHVLVEFGASRSVHQVQLVVSGASTEYTLTALGPGNAVIGTAAVSPVCCFARSTVTFTSPGPQITAFTFGRDAAALIIHEVRFS